MKSKEEAIDFIDSRDVLTELELRRFMFGYAYSKKTKLMSELWAYVLKTKNWKALRDYKEKKINEFNNDKRNKFFELYKKDNRFKELGYKRVIKLLKTVYKLDYSHSSIARYYKLIKSNEVINK